MLMTVTLTPRVQNIGAALHAYAAALGRDRDWLLLLARAVGDTPSAQNIHAALHAE